MTLPQPRASGGGDKNTLLYVSHVSHILQCDSHSATLHFGHANTGKVSCDQKAEWINVNRIRQVPNVTHIRQLSFLIT